MTARRNLTERAAGNLKPLVFNPAADVMPSLGRLGSLHGHGNRPVCFTRPLNLVGPKRRSDQVDAALAVRP